ncbi:PREDICTED: uncharacterized protein LOC109238715 [Nicotiana attenuata]|uniref:uncharacterized protein LOC109238715 n=1 Tax=Nicotiana attenuata TaxID=49451 RepID=UPI00090592CB|nr:PREDICTED: uncharacterized protein LOC109238715 [Nicotiana attenuata]
MGVLAHLAVQRRSLGREIQKLANDGIRLDETEEGDITAYALAQSCLVAHQVKAEHQRPGGLAQDIKIPQWKWEMINMDFVVGLPRTYRKHDSIWVIVDQLTKSAHFLPRPSVHSAFLASISEKIRYQGQSEQRFPSTYRWSGRKDDSDSRRYAACVCFRFWRSPVGWFEPAKVPLIGPEFVCEALEKFQLIRERLKAAQSRQKSYSDKRHRELELMVGDKVFSNVSPMKGVMRFGKKGKLSSRFIGPYEILEKKGNVAYKLALPVELSSVHPVFHVSMLRKYIHDESHIIPADTIETKEGLIYEEVPIEILDRQVRKLRTNDLASVKVLWE